ncbi:hypothetical protein ES319_A02G013000v1 [Gossypium barbadense]|uniref:Ubiquitin-like protease family profile domain-containing protein n=1 Tax=Gossypium barbadense TaxID=3634 RepID=A0A5J5WIW9_GOSBA|nr:hypothetical protein ES319_A02G013000v1 [Gossypium barbadense]
MASSPFDTDTALRLLLFCAEAIEDGDLKSADAFLQNILVLADESPYLYESRMVRYFADALVRRAYGLHPASSYNTFPGNPAPYYHYNGYGINGVIKKVIDDALMGNRRLHLIDFSIPYYYFDGSVLRTLPSFSGGPLLVHVSYILPPFLKKYVDFKLQMGILTRDAEVVNVKLEDELKVVYGNSLAEVDECEIDFKRRREDEMVVVYYKFKLDKLVRDAKAMEGELVRLKEINPTIVIMLDFYSNHSHSNFLTCLEDSFQYYSNTSTLIWRQPNIYLNEYEWDCNRDESEGNNVIRRHQTLSEWQRLFSMAGFTRIPLNHNKDNLSDEGSFFGRNYYWLDNTNLLETMGEEEECLILGYKGCRMFFLSAWKPKVEDGHFNSISTNHQFRQGFNPNPLPLQPLQPFIEGLTLNRLAAFSEIYDILKYLGCRYKFSLVLTWAFKVNNIRETTWGSNEKFSFSIQSTYCYMKDYKTYQFMHHCEKRKLVSISVKKAFESRDGYHFEPSVAKLDKQDHPNLLNVKDYNIDVVVAICLQNRHTSNEVYIVEFCWPATESEISKSLALRIFDDLKHMKATFVTVKVQGTEIKFQEEAISSIPTSSNTAMPLKIAEEARDIHAIEINGHIEQIGKTKRNKQRKSWSKVWVDFDKFEEDGKQVAKCKHCPKVLTGSSKSGTTHLNNHSKVCPGKKKQNQESQLILPVDTNERSSTFDQERSHLDLVKMVIKHQYPLDLAGQEAFKNFVKGLQPMYEFQSRDKLLSDIHRIYNEERKKLQLYFDQLACKLNLIVSLWKNNHGKTAYCCLIARFIDDGWELKMKILGLRKLEHVYDTKVVGGIIRSFVLDWNISKKVCSITVDNSFLNDGMVHQIKEICVSEQGSLSSAHWFISFTLLEDGFREMDSILSKLWKSIEYVTETTHGKLNFQEAVNQVKLQGGKSWDELSFKLESDSDILDNALRSREIFCKLEQIDDNFMLNLSMEEWEKAVTLQSCFKCFDDIKGTQSLTANLYFPKLCNMYEEFGQLKKNNHPFVILMKRKFGNYWSLCNVAFTIAAALDPRLKFRSSCNETYELESMMKLIRFRKVLMDVYFEYANEAKNLSASSSVLDDSNSLTAETTKDCIVSYFSKFASPSNVKKVASQKSELDCYLEETLLPSDADILGWWRVNSQRFPTLAKMARDFLAIPVSVSAPCSNISAMTTNPTYSSLDPESMEALVCSQNWLESTKENDGEHHEPMQNMDKRKRKMEENGTSTVKVFKNRNHEKASSNGDIASDFNKNDGSLSFDNWMEPQCSSSESVGEKAEIMEASVRNRDRLESSIGKPNRGRNIAASIEIPNDEPSFNSNQLDQFQSSSSESDEETTLREQGSWCREDVRTYLVSSFTDKEKKRLNRWERSELSGKLIGRDKEFKLMDEKLTPLLMVPHCDETLMGYYIDDSVVNAFFKLLKKRSDKYPNVYIKHYSFDPQIATCLIKGSKLEGEVLAWFKAEKLRGVHKLFLPMCLSAHWVLFCVDTREKKISWLDPIPSSRIKSNNVEKQIILQWFTNYLLPEFGYNDADEWPFVVRTDIPKQENSIDCGVFVMKYGDCLTHGDFFPFTQKDMIYFRRCIFLDIYRGRLHDKR